VLEAWLGEVVSGFGDRLLPVDAAVADEWGRMSAIRPVPVIDALLAATAKANGLTLVTRNEADVAGLGIEVLNPFET
jgi:predicted nucleic acid-binding protein